MMVCEDKARTVDADGIAGETSGGSIKQDVNNTNIC